MAPGRKTGGRKPGSLNKVTIEVKTALLECFEDIGGQDRFASWAELNPEKFYPLWAKALTSELKADISGRLELPVVLI